MNGKISRFLGLWAVCGSLLVHRAQADDVPVATPNEPAKTAPAAEPTVLNLDAPPAVAGKDTAKSAPAAKATDFGSCQPSRCIFVPNMIGEGLGIPITGFAFNEFAVIPYPAHIAKIGENHNVLPQDRISFSYGYYNSFPTVIGSAASNRNTDLHDFKFIAEKTFLGGRASAEIIVPFAYTLDSNQERTTAAYGARALEFGNIAFGGKLLVIDRSNFALSTGFLVEAPTADDLVVTSGFGTEELKNDPWFFTPYVGARWTPNDRLFGQAFASYRRATGDYRAFSNGVAVGSDYDVQDLLMLDGSVGYWLYRNSCGRVRGIAPTVELHYATTTTDSQEAFNSTTINRVDSLNLTVGATALIGDRGTVALGVNIPLNDGNLAGFGPTNRAYDWNLAVQVNLFFGGGRR